MLKKIIALSVLTFFFSCNDIKQHNAKRKQEQKKSYLQELLQSAINNDKMHDIYYPLLTKKEISKIVIIKDSALGVNDSLKLTISGIKLKILPFNKNIDNYIEFEKIEIKKDSAFINFLYNWDVVHCQTKYKNINGKFKLTSVRFVMY